MCIGRSRAAAASKVELFVIAVNGWKTITIVTKSSTSDVAAVLDVPVMCIEHQQPLYYIFIEFKLVVDRI